MRRRFLTLILLLCSTCAAANAGKDHEGRAWIESIKARRLGPFDAVRWFCADGSVLPPTPYACRPHGGGRQHGQRAAQANALRADGILLANVLAEISPTQALADHARLLRAVLVEQHLMALDDGWIFRQARYTRGVFQIEADILAVSAILHAMLAKPVDLDSNFLLAREAVRRLPGDGAGSLLDAVRSGASLMAERDPGFARWRNKIHSRPEASDAEAVRRHADSDGPAALRAEYLILAQQIEAAYRTPDLAKAIEQLSTQTKDSALAELARAWREALDPLQQLALTARAMGQIRERLSSYPAAHRLAALRLSLQAEDAAFSAARGLALSADKQSPQTALTYLGHLLKALYGCGLLTQREWRAGSGAIDQLLAQPQTTLGSYRQALDLLARPPVWAANRLQYEFGETIRSFSRIESRADWLIPDRLRASPALSYGDILERLSAQADRMADIRHELFGRSVSRGLRALNPGLARGPLKSLESLATASGPPAIVLAPESAADLPAVAGILTAAEGNALSHVQLLARNLGIPNVVVGSEWLATVAARQAQDVVLAASPAGVVRLSQDGPSWAPLFPARSEAPVEIRVDQTRLNLAPRDPISMRHLRTDDSGRVVGPKAAKLGELSSRYPGLVSAGLALPFGAFRAVLDGPARNGSGSLLDWMRGRYQHLHALPEGAQRQQQTRDFLAALRRQIEDYTFSSSQRESLRRSLNAEFGTEGSYGVFVRSDTNVEDLPGFTGAGLNLTIANVVGMDAILDAIRQVWASPFTERAYGWRQALMDQPEQLYVAVLLHKTVPADKSGVLITADLRSDDENWITVATNEGVGGGVEGQAAESLRINTRSGSIDLLASATESRQRRVLPQGGSQLLRATTPEYLLQPEEIQALLEITRSLPQKYPRLIDALGRPAPADIEFAFVDGQLYLNQIRPFLQSDRARSNAYLISLDAGLKAAAGRPIDLRAVP